MHLHLHSIQVVWYSENRLTHLRDDFGSFLVLGHVGLSNNIIHSFCPSYFLLSFHHRFPEFDKNIGDGFVWKSSPLKCLWPYEQPTKTKSSLSEWARTKQPWFGPFVDGQPNTFVALWLVNRLGHYPRSLAESTKSLGRLTQCPLLHRWFMVW